MSASLARKTVSHFLATLDPKDGHSPINPEILDRIVKDPGIFRLLSSANDTQVNALVFFL